MSADARPGSRPKALLSLVLTGALCTPAFAAEPVDITRPLRRTVGPPGGAAPMPGVDARRTGLSPVALPRQPRVRLRARAPGPIDLPPIVVERGHIVLATIGGQLAELDADGEARWTLRTGSRPIAGPLSTSGGLRVIVTASREVLAADSRGRVRYRRALPSSDRRAAAEPLATDFGAVVVALGPRIWRLGPAGEVEAEAALDELVVAMVLDGGTLVVVTESGTVHGWRSPAAPRKLGDFGGRVKGRAALAPGKRLLAVVERSRLVELNLSTGTRYVRARREHGGLRPGPVITGDGGTLVLDASGSLVRHDARGHRTLEAPLAGVPPSPPPPGRAPTGARPQRQAAAPLTDASGWSAVAAAGAELVLLAPTGEAGPVDGTACGSPVAVLPTEPGSLLLACGSGMLWLIEDAPDTPFGPPDG